MVERVSATPAALELIATLTRLHGPVMFFQSGGCCENSVPLCYPAGEFKTSPNDVYLGMVGGAPYYMSGREFRVLSEHASDRGCSARARRHLCAGWSGWYDLHRPIPTFHGRRTRLDRIRSPLTIRLCCRLASARPAHCADLPFFCLFPGHPITPADPKTGPETQRRFL
jgi:hypothetical protein